MNPRHGNWAPSPELLAAYFDGEFEGRDDLAPMRQRLEDWLALHPSARDELADYSHLRQLWLDSSPPEPAPETWDGVLAKVEAECRQRRSAKVPGRLGRMGAAAIVAAACVGMGILLTTREKAGPTPSAPIVVQDDEPFPVATENEVVVLRVEGADTQSLVRVTLPLHGPLELAGPGDVIFGQNTQPHVQVGGSGRPMVWARLDPDE